MLVGKVRNIIQADESIGALRGGAVSPEVQVAVVILLMSGASYINLMIILLRSGELLPAVQMCLAQFFFLEKNGRKPSKPTQLKSG